MAQGGILQFLYESGCADVAGGGLGTEEVDTDGQTGNIDGGGVGFEHQLPVDVVDLDGYDGLSVAFHRQAVFDGVGIYK